MCRLFLISEHINIYLLAHDINPELFFKNIEANPLTASLV